MAKAKNLQHVLGTLWPQPRGSGHQSRLSPHVALCLGAVVVVCLLLRFRAEYNHVRASRLPQWPAGGSSSLGGHGTSTEQTESELEALSMANAGNSTLGFHSIKFVNMKTRYDRGDAATLQAYLSGIDLEDFPAVEKDMISDVGMPPTSRPGRVHVPEQGCWRAHANIWTEVLRKRRPPVLIFESDATWDINIRPIMANLNKYFVEFLRRTNSTPMASLAWESKTASAGPSKLTNLTNCYSAEHPSLNTTLVSAGLNASSHAADDTSCTPHQTAIQYDPDDPWLSDHWDLLSFGHCREMSRHQEHRINMIYPDPYLPSGQSYYGYTLGRERVIRKSGGLTCTAAYAISQRGAAKLLLRSALDLDNPVDLLMRRMTVSGDLVVYSFHPTIIAQWAYYSDIGMDGRAQSDIRGGGQARVVDKDALARGWDRVRNDHSVWRPHEHPGVAFETMALQTAWEKIFGDAKLINSQYNETEDY